MDRKVSIVNNAVSLYVKTLKDVLKNNGKNSFLNAVIINDKVTNIIMGHPVTSENFDVVSFDKSKDLTLTDSFFTLFEQYVRMGIHELTGVTYTEFKKMTVIEKDIFLEYVDFKLSTTDLVNEEIKELENINNSNNNPFDL